MNKEIYLVTIYHSNRRIGMQIIDHPAMNKNLHERASVIGRAGAMFHGDDASFKVWECREVEPVPQNKGE